VIPEPSGDGLCRILSLDGGGAKGFYTLGVLKEIEAMINRPLYSSFDLAIWSNATRGDCSKRSNHRHRPAGEAARSNRPGRRGMAPSVGDEQSIAGRVKHALARTTCGAAAPSLTVRTRPAVSYPHEAIARIWQIARRAAALDSSRRHRRLSYRCGPVTDAENSAAPAVKGQRGNACRYGTDDTHWLV
jgi:hypothetical protein